MSAATAIQSVTRSERHEEYEDALDEQRGDDVLAHDPDGCRARPIAAGRRVRSSLMRATSAESSAIALPAAPIATPMRAAARAGASLMPSPTIATAPTVSSRSRTRASLSCGQQRGVVLADADAVGDVARDGVVVAGEHDDPLDRAPAQRDDGFAASGRGSSRSPNAASGRFPSPSRITVWPCGLELGDARRGEAPRRSAGEARAAGPEFAPVERRRRRGREAQKAHRCRPG